MSRTKESPVLEFLGNLIKDTPQVQRAARRERLRLELARFMKKAREAAGLTQKDVAKALSVTQAWVSKLESPNYDHKLESVLSYFDAIGGEMNLSVDVGESTFQIWGDAPVWEAPAEPTMLALLGELFITDRAVYEWEIQEPTDTRASSVVPFKPYRKTTNDYREATAL